MRYLLPSKEKSSCFYPQIPRRRQKWYITAEGFVKQTAHPILHCQQVSERFPSNNRHSQFYLLLDRCISPSPLWGHVYGLK